MDRQDYCTLEISANYRTKDCDIFGTFDGYKEYTATSLTDYTTVDSMIKLVKKLADKSKATIDIGLYDAHKEAKEIYIRIINETGGTKSLVTFDRNGRGTASPIKNKDIKQLVLNAIDRFKVEITAETI